MRILMVFIVLVLSACGTAEKTINQDEPVAAETPIVSEAANEVFVLQLISEKKNYKVGEQLEIRAELTYNGEEPITIGHGGSWIHLATTNLTKDYQFGSAMIEPYLTTSIKPGEKVIREYKFSGATYHHGMLGAKYSEEEFKLMGQMKFPIGQYKIEGLTDFQIEGEGITIKLKTEIVFNVIE